MNNNILITLWIDKRKEEEFLAEVEDTNTPVRKVQVENTAGSVMYQLECFAVSATAFSVDIAYEHYGCMHNIGCLIENLLSYQVSCS